MQITDVNKDQLLDLKDQVNKEYEELEPRSWASPAVSHRRPAGF